MKRLFRKLWMALGKPVRSVIRNAVRAEVQSVIVEELPKVVGKIEHRAPVLGSVATAVLMQELGKKLR